MGNHELVCELPARSFGQSCKIKRVSGRAGYPQKLHFNQSERGRKRAERKIRRSLWLPTHVVDPSSRLSCATGEGFYSHAVSWDRFFTCSYGASWCSHSEQVGPELSSQWVSCFPQWGLLSLGLGESGDPKPEMCEGTGLPEDEGCSCLPWGCTHHTNR